MEHGIGSGSPAPGYQARPGEGVMVHRLSVAGHDSGAESPVYGEEPSASVDRDPAAKPPWVDGGGLDWTTPRYVGTAASRLARTYDMSVVDPQSGRWYVKDIRASTQPMGTQ
jgi:hypothetical protein